MSDSVIKPLKNYTLITSVLFWAGLAVMSSLYLTIPLIPVFAKAFSVTSATSAWTSSAFSFSFAVGCLIYGPLSDKLGRKTVILTGLAVLSAATLLTGLVNHLPVLILCRGVQGLAAATFSPVSLAYVADTFPAQKRVTGIGFISTGFLVAGVAGQVFSSYLSGKYSWNAVFYVLGIIYVITYFLVLWFIPKSPVNQTKVGVKTITRQIGSFLKQKNLVCAYMIALTLLLSFVGMYATLSSYLSSPSFSLSGQQILYVRMAGILGMLLSPFAGKFAAKIGSFSVLRGGLILSGAGLLLLGIGRNLSLLVVSSIVFVSGIALVVPTLIDLIGRLGRKARGTAVSVYTFVLFCGASIGPIFATGILQQGNYSQTFFALALCLGAAIFASFFIHEGKDSEQG